MSKAKIQKGAENKRRGKKDKRTTVNLHYKKKMLEGRR